MTAQASARRPWLAGYAAFHAFAAWVGAFGLLTGGTDFGETINDRLPFDSLILAGLALGIIVGIPLTVLAWSAWTGESRTQRHGSRRRAPADRVDRRTDRRAQGVLVLPAAVPRCRHLRRRRS